MHRWTAGLFRAFGTYPFRDACSCSLLLVCWSPVDFFLGVLTSKLQVKLPLHIYSNQTFIGGGAFYPETVRKLNSIFFISLVCGRFDSNISLIPNSKFQLTCQFRSPKADNSRDRNRDRGWLSTNWAQSLEQPYVECAASVKSLLRIFVKIITRRR